MTLDLEHIKQIKREPIKIQVPEWGGSIEARFVTVGQFTSFRKRMKNLAEEDYTLELCVFLIDKPDLDSDAGREVIRGMSIAAYSQLQEDLLVGCGLSVEEEKKS